jgi:hypothetical protein
VNNLAGVVMFVLFAIVLILAAFFAGTGIAKTKITEDCQKIGKSVILGKAYECKPIQESP